MPADYRQLTEFLVNLGIEQVHHTQRNYLAHLIAVYNLMRTYGQEEDLCRAGMFHSIYGTEKFQGFKLTYDRRDDVAQLIGERAEYLAYWNCCMDRESFDRLLGQTAGVFAIRNRETGEDMHLSCREYDDLCAVHLFDWLEQAPRSRFGWDYRRQAYRQMAQRLGGRAEEAHQLTYSQEPLAS
jgi:(p)ppGpp synthase/HD superfamily hydrolase